MALWRASVKTGATSGWESGGATESVDGGLIRATDPLKVLGLIAWASLTDADTLDRRAFADEMLLTARRVLEADCCHTRLRNLNRAALNGESEIAVSLPTDKSVCQNVVTFRELFELLALKGL